MGDARTHSHLRRRRAARHASSCITHDHDQSSERGKSCPPPCHRHSQRGSLPPFVILVEKLAAHKVIETAADSIMAAIIERRRGLSTMKLFVAMLFSSMLFTDAVYLRANRNLETAVIQSFNVNLVLALHFVNDETATALETKDKSNAIVEHFCNKVQEQVSGNDVSVSCMLVG